MKRARALWIVLLLLYAVVIFTLSSLPLGVGEPLVRIPHGDKFLHFLEFFVFFLLSWKALSSQHRIFYSLMLTAIYAGSDEIHQLFVATRVPSLFDWLADLAGGASAAVLVYLLIRVLLPRTAKVRILNQHKKEG